MLVLGNKRKMFSPFSKEEIEKTVFNLEEILLIINKYDGFSLGFIQALWALLEANRRLWKSLGIIIPTAAFSMPTLWNNFMRSTSKKTLKWK